MLISSNRKFYQHKYLKVTRTYHSLCKILLLQYSHISHRELSWGGGVGKEGGQGNDTIFCFAFYNSIYGICLIDFLHLINVSTLAHIGLIDI